MFSLLLFLSILHTASGSFAVIGDWGRGGTIIQQEVGYALRQKNVSFVISVGDNIYPSGIQSTADPKILQWEAIYKPRVPWYFVAGNHDYRGNVDAQVELTSVYTYWNMPARYYDIVLDEGHFFFIDTTPWVRGEDVDAQRKWLLASYRSSNAARKFIVGHHPLWTCGFHHKNEQLKLLHDTLIPLLRGGGIYFAGHDHNLQHIQREDVHQFISGAGAYTYDVRPCEGMTYGTGTDTGFMIVDGASYSFHNRYGDVLYGANL